MIPCPHQLPTRGDNTQFKVVLPLLVLPSSFCHWTEYLEELYTYIYIYARSIKSRDYIFSVQFGIFKKCVYFWPLMSHNHMGMVVLREFYSCWKPFPFNQNLLDAYCTVVWRRFEATFKLRPVILIFERNEMTACPRKPQQPTSIGITWHTKKSLSWTVFFYPILYVFTGCDRRSIFLSVV